MNIDDKNTNIDVQIHKDQHTFGGRKGDAGTINRQDFAANDLDDMESRSDLESELSMQ